MLQQFALGQVDRESSLNLFNNNTQIPPSQHVMNQEYLKQQALKAMNITDSNNTDQQQK